MDTTEYLLASLAEECAEVAQRVSKALRFGLGEIQPGQPLSNSERITAELADLVTLFEILHDERLLPFYDPESVAVKKRKVAEFMAYARQCGRLTGPVARCERIAS